MGLSRSPRTHSEEWGPGGVQLQQLMDTQALLGASSCPQGPGVVLALQVPSPCLEGTLALQGTASVVVWFSRVLYPVRPARPFTKECSECLRKRPSVLDAPGSVTAPLAALPAVVGVRPALVTGSAPALPTLPWRRPSGKESAAAAASGFSAWTLGVAFLRVRTEAEAPCRVASLL